MEQAPRDLIKRFGDKHKHVNELKFISECGEDLIINIISGLGLVNYIYLVQSADKKNSVILKYGEEKAASPAFKDFNFSIERQRLEYNCLKLVDKFCPGGVPKPYVYDRDMQIIAMEYLDNAKTLTSVLCGGEVGEHLASELGRILGCCHFNTHRKVVSEETWQDYMQTINNKTMVQNMVELNFETLENYNGKEDFIMPLDENHFKEMQAEINSKRLFDPIRNLFLREDCFGHIDGHGLAVMVSKQKCSFIDFEFGGLCSHSFTLGKLMTSYLFALHDVRNKMEDKKELTRLTKQAMRKMVDAFMYEFGEMVHILGPLEKFFDEMASVLGHFVFIISLVSSSTRDPWFRGTDESIRRLTEKGFYIIKNHSEITSMDSFIQALFDDKLISIHG